MKEMQSLYWDPVKQFPSQWEGSTKKTYFIIDNKTGERTEIIKNLNGSVAVSPLGNLW
jgi:hypothetical protein